MPSRNLAARAGRWSAQHRKKAIFGWLAFVIIATVLGGMVGQRTIAEEDYGNGQSRAADQAIADAGFPDEASEQVLVQGKGSTKIGDPGFTAAVQDTVRRLEAVPHVADVASPLAKANAGQLSDDGRSGLITFKLRGDEDVLEDRVGPAENAVAAAQKAHPDLRVEQFGDASADKALSESFDEDFQKAEVLSLPITLVILIVAFGALVAAGLPLLLGITSVAATIGLLGPLSQIVALDEAVELGGAAGRARRRGRLLDVLPAPRDGGARRRPGARGGAQRRGRNVRARGADLRLHGHGRDGGHVLRRQLGVHLVRGRHHPRRRGSRSSAR